MISIPASNQWSTSILASFIEYSSIQSINAKSQLFLTKKASPYEKGGLT